jgi:hypothetical protein
MGSEGRTFTATGTDRPVADPIAGILSHADIVLVDSSL